ARRPAARAVPRLGRTAPARGARAAAPRCTGGDDLRLRPDRDRLGAARRGRGVRGSAARALSRRDRPAARDDAERSRTTVSTNPYDRPVDPAKRRSAAVTNGPERAGARSMLKAV